MDEREESVSGRRLIVGLGNPGGDYEGTRHNVGFEVVEELARRRGLRLATGDCHCRLAKAPDLVLVQPLAYMNRSGWPLRCLVERGELAAEEVPTNLLVVFDDVHLPLGKLRLRREGSPGGHRGLESIVENLRSAAIPRLRLGVGPAAPLAGEELPDFVLGRFAGDEARAASDMVKAAADACEVWLQQGIEAAMNRFNG